MASRTQPDPLRTLIDVIVTGDHEQAIRLLAASPKLAKEAAARGAIRQNAKDNFFVRIRHYINEGDTALHMAAAANQLRVAEALIARGADVSARNRRGAEPLHYAVDVGPDSLVWNPADQTAMIAMLIRAGADPNARDKSGVGPLHRAVRNRGSGAVSALIMGGADPRSPNKNGSTPMLLATLTTGKSGSGSVASKEQQQEIIRILRAHGAS